MVTGQDASILRSKQLTANAGSYSISGKDATITYHAAGGAVWPPPNQVAYGVVYGPTGVEYTGTFIGNTTIDIVTGQLVKPLSSKLSMLLV